MTPALDASAIDVLLAGLDQPTDRPVAQRGAELTPAERWLVGSLSGGPWARDALRTLRDVLSTIDEIDWRHAPQSSLAAFSAVARAGPDLARLLRERPIRARQLIEDAAAESHSRIALHSELTKRLSELEQTDEAAIATCIARFRNDHYVRLAGDEFVRGTLEQVGAGLADLADVCLDAAISWALARQAQRGGGPLTSTGDAVGFCAIAMGKYGARELNFCSDIDVVFLYQTDEGQAGEASLHEFFCAVCRRVIRLLSEPSAEGFSFRVDVRLRPEGARGPLCNSLASAERYYETWGGPYDRLAWIKARPAAGDVQLGAAMCDILSPFVFPRSQRGDPIAELGKLTDRIRTQLAEQRLSADGFNVKLASGGIRDVEFFVQALQLLHGGKQPALRAPSTLAALDRLLFGGLISEMEHRTLAEGYEFLRRIEHRLQLYGGRQTHLLPDSGALRQHLIAHLGLEVEEFESMLARVREDVAEIYRTLSQGSEPNDEVSALLHCDFEELVGHLDTLGFADARSSAQQLALLRERPTGPFSRNGDHELGHALIADICAAPDCDAALRHLTSLSLRYGAWRPLWRLLAANDAVRRLLVNLFGTSDYLANILLAAPDLVDSLLLAGELLDDAPIASFSLSGQIEDQLRDVLRIQRAEALRVGLADIGGLIEMRQVTVRLAALADAVIAACLELVASEIEQRYGQPQDDRGQRATLAVIGLGSLGAREMIYGSDLDLLFVYSADGQTDGPRRVTNAEFFTRMAQRLVNMLSTDLVGGRLYSVDTRLRPSGRQGTLVVSSSSFYEYHQRCQLWERQVLLKARVVAGESQFAEQLEQSIAGLVYRAAGSVAPTELATEMCEMRARIERELGESRRGFYNIKFGPGGLVDIDFIAQYFQLAHGADHVALRVRSTADVLRAAPQVALICEADGAALLSAYSFLRRLESRLRIVRDRSANLLPSEPEATEVVARRLGYRRALEQSAGAALLSDYLEHRAEVRRIFRATIGAVDVTD